MVESHNFKWTFYSQQKVFSFRIYFFYSLVVLKTQLGSSWKYDLSGKNTKIVIIIFRSLKKALKVAKVKRTFDPVWKNEREVPGRSSLWLVQKFLSVPYLDFSVDLKFGKYWDVPSPLEQPGPVLLQIL